VKKYRFPAPDALFRKYLNPASKLRAVLVLALIALVSSLPFYAIAQDGAVVQIKKSNTYSVAADSGSFVIYRGPNGEALCRAATPGEARAMQSDGKGLRQINHFEAETSAPSSINGTTSATGLTIILRATAQLDANPTAKQAFVAAAAKWETLIKDPITIAIDVDFGTTFFGTPFSDANVLGATSSPQFFFDGNYTDVRSRLNNHAPAGSPEAALAAALPATAVPTDIGSVNTVFIGSPLLRALGGFPADYHNDTQSITAPKIAFNSAFGFDFDPSDGITGNLTDFDAVAVHEMGHALGFSSEVGDRELTPSAPLAVTVWDLFRFRPATANLSNFGTAQRILSSGGTQVQFNGGAELGLSTGKPDGTGGDGNQASHWKDDLNVDANFIGIMDPNIRRNHREVMTANDQAAIDSFGYSTTPTTPPPNDNFANAQTLTGSTGTVNGNSVFGTRETGEPTNPSGTGGGRSIWYNWTAPGTGQATFDTNGSSYDTILAVYQGSAVNSLTHLASNDDISPLNDPPPRNIQSRVIFSVTAGQLYRIQVDGFDAAEGTVVLNWTAPGAATPTPTPTPTPAGPNTVQFSVGVASVNETDVSPTNLLVTRTGDTAQAATVNYATSNVSASDRSDYEAALGTLHFAGGVTSATIPIFPINDSFGEGSETFNIALSGPVGCTLGSPAAMVITINSDESVNGANPVKNASFDNDFFVRQHYLDFFNRVADNGGLNFWKGQLSECEQVPLPGGFPDAQTCREIRRINVSAAFFLSIEFQQTGYLVERLYKVAYGDATGTSTLGVTHTLPVPVVRLNEFFPDTQAIGRGVVIGQPGADQLLENNKQALIAEFVSRSRFLTAFPVSMTAAQFVDKLNLNSGNALSQGERDQLVADLTSSAKTRAQVVRAVAEDASLFAAETNRAFVLCQFLGYLRRNPNDNPDSDYTGYDFWLSKLNQFNGNFVNAEMVKSFIVSGEYQGRFGP
jgi:hypothetical protein